MAYKIVAGIYKITNTANGKTYVGSSVRMPHRLATHRSHLRSGTHANQKMQRAWNKYGEAAFEFSVIEEVSDPNSLIAREQFWIDTLNPFYNIAKVAGSPLGVKHTPEAIANMVKARKGKSFSPEARKSMSEAAKRRGVAPEVIAKMRSGRANHVESAETRAKRSAKMTGRKMSPQSIEKTRRAHIGKVIPEELRVRWSESRKGRRLSPEHIEKVRMKLIGRPVSEATRLKMSQSAKLRAARQKLERELAATEVQLAASEGDKDRAIDLHKHHNPPPSLVRDEVSTEKTP